MVLTLHEGPKISEDNIPTKEVLRAGLSQDCALSVTDPSDKAISEPFVRHALSKETSAFLLN